MGWSRVLEAYEDNGDIFVKNEKGFNSALRRADIEKAVKQIHFRCYPKTQAQQIDFCHRLVGNIIDISSLSGAETGTLVEAAKKEREKMASKTKKVEWKLKGVDRTKWSMGTVQEKLEEMKEQIRAMKYGSGDSEVSKSGFKGWVTEKFGEDEKTDELTVTGSFLKSLVEADDFTDVSSQVTKLLESAGFGSSCTVESVEVKE
jgi:hypothetical protein